MNGHCIEIYIVDFYCHELQLVVEVDGDHHLEREQKEWDQCRTGQMESFGIRQLRFTNHQVETNLSEVLSIIEKKCSEIKIRQHLFKKS